MEQVKKLLFFRIPMSICNLRCHYCYLAQRKECYQGVQPVMKYSPQEVAKALSFDRVGGAAFMNFCADGETLLIKDLDLYVKELIKEGHYAEIVTNLTITSALEKFLEWDKELLKHLEFKCSFHYLELKEKKLLNTFAENVKKIWKAGASASIEITPSDELMPYIEELKEFSIIEFGALPHVTIARDDSTKNIDYLTNLSIEEYDRIWSQFNSEFWQYKKSIFGIRQTKFCYAGKWSLYIDLSTGVARQCYCGKYMGDIFRNPNEPLPEEPIGICQLPHCFNGHAFITLGLIPNTTEVGFGDIRNRKTNSGEEWIQNEMLLFLNTKLENTNCSIKNIHKIIWVCKSMPMFIVRKIFPALRTLKMKRHKN